MTDQLQQRAATLETLGLGALDALHAAAAECAAADFFLTCDDRLPHRYSGALKILNPVTFILQLNKTP